jgi:hypothetical protein
MWGRFTRHYTWTEIHRLYRLNDITEKNMTPKDETTAERKARYGRIGTASAKTIKNMLAGTALGDKLAAKGTGGERTIGKNVCAQCSRQFTCPECGHQFQGNDWDGIDAHWRAKHEEIMPYDEAWPLIKSGAYYFAHPSRRPDE